MNKNVAYNNYFDIIFHCLTATTILLIDYYNKTIQNNYFMMTATFHSIYLFLIKIDLCIDDEKLAINYYYYYWISNVLFFVFILFLLFYGFFCSIYIYFRLLFDRHFTTTTRILFIHSFYS